MTENCKETGIVHLPYEIESKTVNSDQWERHLLYGGCSNYKVRLSWDFLCVTEEQPDSVSLVS